MFYFGAWICMVCPSIAFGGMYVLYGTYAVVLKDLDSVTSQLVEAESGTDTDW